jgi:ketosteroid isomerase-like protein
MIATTTTTTTRAHPLACELLELERQYWRAIQSQDYETALRLTDDPCIVTGAQGAARLDQQTFRRMLTDADYTLRDFMIEDDAEVRQLSDDVAVLAYTVRQQLTVDGEPLAFHATDASTWVRRGDRWVCALHAEAIISDPFGRDRVIPPPPPF